MAHKAVIMARGLGTRMRKAAEGVELTDEQSKVADAGVKAMISVGRPFLDHVISALADAGFTDICLVIGPEHDIIRDYYDNVDKQRVSISYAVQTDVLGTARAYLAAKEFCGDDLVAVLNSDNYYPAEGLKLLQGATTSAMLGFEKQAMVAKSNIPADRINAYALIETDQDDHLVSFVEKPSDEQLAAAGENPLISMNALLLGPAVLAAAEVIEPSARGEYEIVDAVTTAMAGGEVVQVYQVAEGVLDMASRGDIGPVLEFLKDRPCQL